MQYPASLKYFKLQAHSKQ